MVCFRCAVAPKFLPELMPHSLNIRKGAKIGQRQIDLANKLHAAGVLFDMWVRSSAFSSPLLNSIVGVAAPSPHAPSCSCFACDSRRSYFARRSLAFFVPRAASLPSERRQTANASASSRRDPTIGSPTSGQRLGEDLQNSVWSERLDFYIPAEAPQGTVKFTIRANAVSAKSVSRTFTFNLAGPQWCSLRLGLEISKQH